MENKKWTWDPEKREVVIHENGEFMLGLSETQYVTVKVEVGNGKTSEPSGTGTDQDVRGMQTNGVS